jgi:hypothetical protein
VYRWDVSASDETIVLKSNDHNVTVNTDKINKPL